MALKTSVDTTGDVGALVLPSVPATLAGFTHAFPAAEGVGDACGLFVPLPAWDGREGARWRFTVGPGMVAVSSVDPARAERTADRAREAAWKAAVLRSGDRLLEHRIAENEADLDTVTLLASEGVVGWSEVEPFADWADHLAGRLERRDAETPATRSKITGWSAKSRARMVKTLVSLDYRPLVEQGVPAMVTLTYPGDWLAVAPSAAAVKRHLILFRKRFARAWGREIAAIWKMEFQRRGAPHFHLLMVPPTGAVNGLGFRDWLSRAWADVVGSDRCVKASECEGCEYHRHLVAGTGVDYREGVRASDPRRVAVYFSKHGSFASKEYQNHAPEAWVEAGSVGRFWGYWGLEVATAVVEVAPEEALTAARTMRRWQNSRGFRVQRTVWRTDTKTGVQRPRRSGVWVGARMRGHRGYVAVNDGPAFASQIARALDRAYRPGRGVSRSGAGPLGFLP